MLIWVTLGGLLLVATLLVVTMLRAERRARRKLFEALELSEETIELLMSRNGDVLAELSLVRIAPPATPHLDAAARTRPPPGPEPPAHRRHPAIRLVHPATDEPDPPTDRTEPDARRHRGG